MRGGFVFAWGLLAAASTMANHGHVLPQLIKHDASLQDVKIEIIVATVETPVSFVNLATEGETQVRIQEVLRGNAKVGTSLPIEFHNFGDNPIPNTEPKQNRSPVLAPRELNVGDTVILSVKPGTPASANSSGIYFYSSVSRHQIMSNMKKPFPIKLAGGIAVGVLVLLALIWRGVRRKVST